MRLKTAAVLGLFLLAAGQPSELLSPFDVLEKASRSCSKP
jgi:hypothetical protein